MPLKAGFCKVSVLNFCYFGGGRDDDTKNGRVGSLFSEEPLLVGLLLSVCK